MYSAKLNTLLTIRDCVNPRLSHETSTSLSQIETNTQIVIVSTPAYHMTRAHHSLIFKQIRIALTLENVEGEQGM